MAEAARAWGGRVLLVRGDSLLVERRAEAVRTAHLAGAADFGALEILQGDTVDAEGVATAVLTLTFAPRRVVWVRHADRLREDVQRMLLDLLDGIPPGTLVLLTAGAVDGRRSLFAELERRGWSEAQEPASAEALVSQLARERGVRLAPEAAGVLSEFLGSDAARVDGEMEKLALLYESRPVDAPMALASLGGDRALAQFELANALRARRSDLAIRALRDALARGSRIHQVVGQLAHELRSLLRGRALLASGLSESEAIRAFGGWAGRYAIAGARRYRLPELRRALATLLEVDIAVKTGRGDAVAKLERLLIALAHDPAAAVAGSR